MTAINNFYERGNTSNPKKMIILLHGLGSNGQDLISLAPLWQKDVPGSIFVSPDAPFACDMTPPDYPNSYQWFSLQDRARENVQAGIEVAFPILEKFIHKQRKRFDLELKDVVLVGFSQGTMMSLYSAPRLPETIAGVLGYSGALFGEEALMQDPDEFVKPPVHLIHGESDDVVPVAAFSHAKDSLESAGFSVSGHTTPGLTHSIDEAGVQSGGNFLSKVTQ